MGVTRSFNFEDARGGRPPLCVLAKLAGEGSGNAPASPREHQWPRQETGHCPRSARAAQQQHRRD